MLRVWLNQNPLADLQISKSTNITEVIANRETMRNKIREEMQGVVQGWGVWLETVEITDVPTPGQTTLR